MSLKLYIDLLSQPSRALAMFMRATKIPYSEVQIAIRKGEQKSDEYTKINRFQRVPAIVHDGFQLSESIAILRYLCRTFEVKEHWYPKDSQKMAKVDEYLEWQHLGMRASGSLYFRELFMRPALTGNPANPEKVEKLATGLENTLDLMENNFLKENKFIAGQELTIADLLATAELEQPRIVGYDVSKNHPKIGNYMDLVKKELDPIYGQVHDLAWSTGQKWQKKILLK